jgi:hypothetical protein
MTTFETTPDVIRLVEKFAALEAESSLRNSQEPATVRVPNHMISLHIHTSCLFSKVHFNPLKPKNI